ncbi:MAG: hypothetical protein KY434_03195, partial [Actinobacteria bacterium]|nr:hypothetical protein [Actinomycetota bacterium]
RATRGAPVAGPREIARGLLAAAATALLLTVALAEGVGIATPGVGRLSGAALLLAGGGLCVSLVATARSLPAGRRTAGTVARRLARPWTAPPGGWVFFALGTVAAAPFAAVHTDVTWYVDSARMLAALHYVRSGGLQHLLHSQEVLMPHLTLSPAVAAWGIAGASAVNLVFLFALSGIVCLVAWRATGDPLAGLLASAALLSLDWVAAQATALTMYFAMLAFGYAGAWLSYRALAARTGARRWWTAVAAGACLVLSAESHGVGQLFLASPLLLLAIAPRVGPALRAAGRVYLAAFVLFLPRAMINYAEGGFTSFRRIRTNFLIEQGYLRMINRNLYQGMFSDPLEYFGHFVSPLAQVLGDTARTTGALIVVALVLARGRARWLAVGCASLWLLAMLVKMPVPFPRYFSPLLPGAAICAGVGAHLLLRRRWSLRGRPVPRAALALTLTVLMVGGAGLNAVFGTMFSQDMQRWVDARPFAEMVQRIDDDRSVFGVRATQMFFVDNDNATYNSLNATEADFVTYLTWPSDEQVVRMLRRLGAGWVYVQRERWKEVAYHETWLRPRYGKRVRHLQSLDASPRFCKVFADDGYALYRVGACRPALVTRG